MGHFPGETRNRRNAIDLAETIGYARHVLRGVAVILMASFTTLHAQTDKASCFDCHDDAELVADDGRAAGVLPGPFSSSVHGDLDCVDCHTSPGDYEDTPHYDPYVPVACADCHEDAWDEYEVSVHRLGRGRVPDGAATCVSCHGTHYVRAVSDTLSMVHPRNIPNLCGECHGAEAKTTIDYVRLPIAVPNYLASVHGIRWRKGEKSAVCTDCHGAHNSRIAQDPKSSTNRHNVSATCGQCHTSIAAEFENSIHGRALALGIEDAPTCTDCHGEHLIREHGDPLATVSQKLRAEKLCGNCHSNPALLAKYGITSGVVESYFDSYHGWAVDRGSTLAATCTDCHKVHEIRSRLDPLSSVHESNVSATCGRCHVGAGATFARSYTHESALKARGVHGWVRVFYIGLIAVVLGGMALHNLIVARFELAKHFHRRRKRPYVVRWGHAERLQHLVLLLSFIGLAVTGFALRYPNAWWVDLLGLGGHEVFRAGLHRAFAIIMLVAAVYHVAWLVAASRGRRALQGVSPRAHDFRQVVQNMAFHLGLRRDRPAFGAFDYTQKAEYWAVVWGTWIMALTGFILWYPTVATSFLPVWIIRVSEVIHYYEAILAVAAIFVWHFFYVIFLPSEYPMSTVWIDGRMPADEWKESHRGEYARLASESDDSDTDE